jgi:hypothetical protein
VQAETKNWHFETLRQARPGVSVVADGLSRTCRQDSGVPGKKAKFFSIFAEPDQALETQPDFLQQAR